MEKRKRIRWAIIVEGKSKSHRSRRAAMAHARLLYLAGIAHVIDWWDPNTNCSGATCVPSAEERDKWLVRTTANEETTPTAFPGAES